MIPQNSCDLTSLGKEESHSSALPSFASGKEKEEEEEKLLPLGNSMILVERKKLSKNESPSLAQPSLASSRLEPLIQESRYRHYDYQVNYSRELGRQKEAYDWGNSDQDNQGDPTVFCLQVNHPRN